MKILEISFRCFHSSGILNLIVQFESIVENTVKITSLFRFPESKVIVQLTGDFRRTIKKYPLKFRWYDRTNSTKNYFNAGYLVAFNCVT
jgi:hypothetical protein